MDIEPTEDHEILRGLTRDVLRDLAPIAVVREMEDHPKGYPDALWKQFSEVGLLGLLVPEAYGGSGQSLLEAIVVYEEFGRALTPSPHFASCVLGARALARAGSETQRKRWLPGIASGDAILTPAWIEPGNGWGARGVQLRAEADGDGFVLNGTKRHVPFASAADRLLVLARSGDADEAIDLFLVDAQAPGVTLRQQKSMASDTQYRVDLDGVRVGSDDRIGAPASGWTTWAACMREAIVLLAAQAVGGASQALDLTTAYAKEREQFGKPLGAFQSLAHYLADASTRIEAARVMVAQAAWTHSVGREIDELAPMAKLFACDTYRDTTASCQQIWGGVGFTIEYDIQLYFRRAKQLQITWYDPSTLEEQIAALELDR